jgi:hypothetical protein
MSGVFPWTLRDRLARLGEEHMRSKIGEFTFS